MSFVFVRDTNLFSSLTEIIGVIYSWLTLRLIRLESTFQEFNDVFNNTFSYIKFYLLYNKQVGNN